jgi:hypothetical protein
MRIGAGPVDHGHKGAVRANVRDIVEPEAGTLVGRTGGTSAARNEAGPRATRYASA